MATTAQIQAQLDVTELKAKIVRSANCTSTKWSHYVVCNGVTYDGHSRWIDTNVASSASAQATAIIAALA